MCHTASQSRWGADLLTGHIPVQSFCHAKVCTPNVCTLSQGTGEKDTKASALKLILMNQMICHCLMVKIFNYWNNLPSSWAVDLYDLKSLNWMPFKRRCFGWTVLGLFTCTRKCPGLCWTWGQISSRVDSSSILLLFRWSALQATSHHTAPHREVPAWLSDFSWSKHWSPPYSWEPPNSRRQMKRFQCVLPGVPRDGHL